MRICIVLPTYNEKENIGILLQKLMGISSKIKKKIEKNKEVKNPKIKTRTKKQQKHHLDILVVDDNSPDGTALIVKEFMKKHDNVRLLEGKKQGLGVAYKRGFAYCLKKDYDIVFEMDSDLSHDPEAIPYMIKTMEEGYDMVIGSRYVKNGEIRNWNFLRKMISKGGNFFARIIAGLYDVKDCTSGFRAIKTSQLKKIDLENIDSHGYSFQMELLYLLLRDGTKIKEIPITFIDRKKGSTKLGIGDIAEFFLHAFRLRFKKA